MGQYSRKLWDRVKCWWLGHDPDLSECRKIVLPYHEEDAGFILIRRMGRNLYFGKTHCKRCGMAQWLIGGIAAES